MLALFQIKVEDTGNGMVDPTSASSSPHDIEHKLALGQHPYLGTISPSAGGYSSQFRNPTGQVAYPYYPPVGGTTMDYFQYASPSGTYVAEPWKFQMWHDQAGLGSI